MIILKNIQLLIYYKGSKFIIRLSLFIDNRKCKYSLY